MGMLTEFKEFAMRGNVIDLAVGVVIVVALHGLRRLGERLCRRRDVSGVAETLVRRGWGAIVGRAIARTNNFFIVMLAAKLVAGYAGAPSQVSTTINFLWTVASVFQAAIWARELILGAIEHRTSSEHYSGEALLSAMGLIRLLVTVALFAVALVVVLDNLGVNVTGLIAGLGVGGIAIGLAAQGMKPVAEAQFDGFMYPMVDHIVCHAARLRYRTRGRLHCPMVLRVPWGGGIRAPEHHSEANEAIFTNVPGLRVVLPSSPQRAYGLLLAAIREPDPVIYMEPKRIYRQYKEEVPDDGEALPLDVCFVLRDGTDVTLVTWGAQVKEALEAADKLAGEGISAEVIDVATLRPLDFATIAESVAKTGRCVIVQEAPKTAGFGAEIAARLAEESIYDLLAPVERVTGYDTHIPLFRLEMKYLPSVERIVAAAKRAVAAG